MHNEGNCEHQSPRNFFRKVVLTNRPPLKNSHITVNNSDYLFLQPIGNSTVTLNNSHMCEFIPRDFMGTMEFNNAKWTIAGEIIGDVAYH